MYGTVTKYMGTAFTGLGITHKYDSLIERAAETVFLKCPPTRAISKLLNETAMHYIKRGHDVDKLMNPTQPEETDAIYVKELNILYLQASHPVALEPSEIGGRHRVISFYEVYDEEVLRRQNEEMVACLGEIASFSEKALQALASAKSTHDDWESVNIKGMQWEAHEQLIECLREHVFQSMNLNKTATVMHRLVGSLTSAGALDYIGSITQRMQRRMLIKGVAGSGKSTLMRALGKEAERRGIDVLYGWCGLDPSGVDLVQFPELSICFIDATAPHAYEVERAGDEVIDLTSMCSIDEQATKKIASIEEIYREKILDAAGYLQAYAQAEKKVKAMMDQAIDTGLFEEKARLLLAES